MRNEKEIRRELEDSKGDIKISSFLVNKENEEFNKGWVKALEWVLGEHKWYERSDWRSNLSE